MRNRILSIQQELRTTRYASGASLTLGKSMQRRALGMSKDHTSFLPVFGLVTKNGKPVTNAKVKLMKFRSSEGNINYTPLIKETKTNAKGVFLLGLKYSSTSIGSLMSAGRINVDITTSTDTYEVHIPVKREEIVASVIKNLLPKPPKASDKLIDLLHDLAGLKRGTLKKPMAPAPELVHFIAFDNVELSVYE